VTRVAVPWSHLEVIMYETFGTNVSGGTVQFQLFFPDSSRDASQYVRGGLPKIAQIRVVGDFQSQLGQSDWDPTTGPLMTQEAHPKGWLYRCQLPKPLKEGFYQYKYFVTFENQTTRWCTDPCTKYGGADDNENSAFVVGGNTTTVHALGAPLSPRDLVAYELMIDDFTAEYRGTRAPVDAVMDRLDYLQGLGVNAIEFMPFTAWPGGGFSWGYDPVQFFSVEYRYINDNTAPADKLFRLKSLINELHRRGIHVIMDGVFNHVAGGANPNRGFGYKWLYQDPEDTPFIGTFGGGGYFDDLDYHNGCVQEFIRDVCVYWLDVFKVDGIRFDYTLGFDLQDDPNVGITRLVSDVKAFLVAQGRSNDALILEDLPDNRYDAISDTNRIGATACWFDPIMWKLQQYCRNGWIDDEAIRVLDASYQFGTGKLPVTYTENHDHSTLVRQIGGRDRWYKTQPAAIALLTTPGLPMLHNGQEFGDDHGMPESGAERVQARKVNWTAFENDSAGASLRSLYSRLIELRKAHPSLRTPNFYPPLANDSGYGAFTDRGVVIYHRWGTGADGRFERFTIALNFTDGDQRVDIPLYGASPWTDLLNGATVWPSDNFARNHVVHSNWGCVFFSAV
jgi:pullulanase